MAGDTSVPAHSPRVQRITLGVIVGAAFLLVAWIASPLAVGILLGMTLAFTVQPLYERVLARTHGRRVLSAAAITIGSGVVLVALGAAVVFLLTREIVALVATLRDRLATGSIADMIGEGPARALESLGVDRHTIVQRLTQDAEAAASYAASAAGVIVARTTSALLSLFIALLTTYYVLIQWSSRGAHLERLIPLDPSYTRALLAEFRNVGRTVLVGTIVTAIVQGVLAAVGYALARVPHAVAWGVVTAIASFLPVVGTAIVYVPMGIVLLVQGRIGAGVFVLAWGVLVVMALSDYVIRPRVVGEKGQSHPLLMLVALLGGVEVMGLAGLIVGPIAVALLLAVVRLYERATCALPPGRRTAC